MATRIGRSSPSAARSTEENIAARAPPVAAESSEEGGRSSETTSGGTFSMPTILARSDRGQGIKQRDDVGDPLRRLHPTGADEHGITFNQVDSRTEQLREDQPGRQHQHQPAKKGPRQ